MVGRDRLLHQRVNQKNPQPLVKPSIYTKPVFDEPVWQLFDGDHAFFLARTTILYLFY